MTYEETLEYLFSRLPMFQRVGAAAYKNDLSNTIALCQALDNPQNSFKSVHIAGTNGKGSVSSSLAAVFQSCGYKTGLFTSPHLKDYRERIRINGEKISERFVIDFVERTKEAVEHLNPSFFELTCAMAFEYFAKEKVDMAILEVGMGGRLDSTNVISPELAIITSIGMDHEQFLGDTIEKIATEKAGIIKKGVPLVLGINKPSVKATIQAIARKGNIDLYLATEKKTGFKSDLKGSYQRENLVTVATAIEVLRKGGWKLDNKCVKKGLLEVSKLTGFLGRWQEISKNPRIIVDVGHNEDGVKTVVKSLSKEKFTKLHIIWGMVADKDAQIILKLLPKRAIYYWCKANVARGKDSEELATLGMEMGLEGNSYDSVQSALERAKSTAAQDDLIFVGGSVFVVGEVI